MTQEFSTADLYLASLLKSKYKLKIKQVLKEGKQIFFVFDSAAGDIDQLLRDFYAGECEINAGEYVKEIKNLKSMTYNCL